MIGTSEISTEATNFIQLDKTMSLWKEIKAKQCTILDVTKSCQRVHSDQSTGNGLCISQLIQVRIQIPAREDIFFRFQQYLCPHANSVIVSTVALHCVTMRQ